MAIERNLSEKFIKLGGGKNSFWSKPFGTGKQSVAENPLNISPIHSGGIGGKIGGTSFQVGDLWGGNNLSNRVKETVLGPDPAEASKGLPPGLATSFLEGGEKKGEELVGGTTKEMGEGRKDVRDRLQEILQGDSAGAQALRTEQQQQQKKLKAQQALAGGGQMNLGQQQALKRQADMDYAKFTSDEKRRALADLSKEYRGAAGDIMRSSGQYGAIGVGMQPPAAPPSSGGLTVICTELNNQGLLPDEVYRADVEYGRELANNDFFAFYGYMIWAVHVANWMSKSKLLTNIIKYPAISWAKHISGNRNLTGLVLESVGLVVCRTIGKLLYRRGLNYER